MAGSAPLTTAITDRSGARRLQQDVAGCLEARIGAAGLSTISLEHWLARLETPLADLKEMQRSSALDHLAIVDRDADIVEAERALVQLSVGAKTIVFLGTGGSSLGGQTLAQLAGWNIPGGADERQKGRARTRFYDNLDGVTLEGALASLDLAATRFVVISKSGGTPETLTQAAAALAALRKKGLTSTIATSFLGVSDPAPSGKSNALRTLAKSFNFPVLDHPPAIGGRFSALSIVGLLPAMARGLDARLVRAGARDVVDALKAADRPAEFAPAVGAAVAIGLARECGIGVNVMMPYADRLKSFGHWYVQLWAESLGKGGQGTAPLACLGPLDQHSQLQLFMDGPKEHFITVIRAATEGAGPKLPADIAKAAGIDFMAGRSVGDLVAAQAQAVPEALGRAGRPVRTIDLPKLDEAGIGALMMHMMLETILAARLLEVDAFDQPAVELAKVLTRERLSVKT